MLKSTMIDMLLMIQASLREECITCHEADDDIRRDRQKALTQAATDARKVIAQIKAIDERRYNDIEDTMTFGPDEISLFYHLLLKNIEETCSRIHTGKAIDADYRNLEQSSNLFNRIAKFYND